MRYTAIVATFFWVSGGTLLAQPHECPGQHCSAKSEIVNKFCKELGQQGGVIWVEHVGGYCWCRCSCVASNTPVAVTESESKPINELQVGDTVLALQRDGSWKTSPLSYVTLLQSS